MDPRTWLLQLGLERYARAFEENDIDESVLPALSEADLVSMGITSLGHRKKMLAGIALLQGASAQAVAVAAGSAVTPKASMSALLETRSLDPSGRSGGDEPRSGVLWDELRARGYQVQERIGQGGMGEVWLARQVSVDRPVAIKVLKRPEAEEVRVRFAREARAVASLTHPHVVRLYDYLEQGDGSACIVMEYVEGMSLWKLLSRERRLPFSRAGAILVQICDALSEAHAHGLVHRDLKPGNVLLQSADGYRDFVKVVDFGLARFVSGEESRLTKTGNVYGTPRYLSPEQILGLEVSPRSDLYALGVMLYEMLAGKAPFGGEVEASLVFKHVRETPPALPSDVERPAEVDRLLERLLSKAPAMRPPSASALRRELSALLQTRAPSAPGDATPSEPQSVPGVSERRQIAVIDVIAHDEAALAKLDDDAAHAALRKAHAQIDALAKRHGGFLHARAGARAQIVFGAPVARRDDVARALGAALEIRDAIAGMEIGSGTDGGKKKLRPRIGVAAGRAIAGTVREGADAGYFLSGTPLEQAERLAREAPSGEIAVSPETAARVDRFRFESLGPAATKLTGLVPEDPSTPSQAPFVGRKRELEHLARLVDELRGGALHGRVMVIAGEAGIGKSRLVQEVETQARMWGTGVAHGTILDVEVPRDQDALHQIVDSLLALPREVTGRLAALEARVAADALRPEQWPLLYHFVGVPLPGAMQRLYDAMEPQARLSAYRDMLATLFQHEVRRTPLLVVIEDLHWADGPTLDAVDLVAGLARTMPIAVLLTTRVEGEERWKHRLGEQELDRIELAPLRDEDARELAARLGATGDAQKAVVARASGHPLLLAELARVGKERGGALPHSVQELVHARLDRLPPRDRTAIQAAAVLGPNFALADLRQLIGDRDYACARLVDYRFVRDQGETLAFLHALVRDAVYGSLLEEQRVLLHEKCAVIAGDDAALAAMHLERAGSALAAPRYLEAAQRDADAHRYEQALHVISRALAAAKDDAVRARAIEMRGSIALLLGRSQEAIDCYAALRALAKDDAAVYRAEIGRAAALRIATRLDEALAALDRAEQAATAAGIAPARLHHLRGAVFFSQGRLAECRAAHDRAVALARAAGEDAPLAEALSGLADAHYAAGRLASAAKTWTECLALSRAGQLIRIEAVNLPMLAIAHVFLDQPERARDLAGQAVLLAREVSHRRAETLAYGAASLAALALRDFDIAAEHARAAMSLTRESGSVAFEQTALYYLARAQLGLGALDDAKTSVAAGLALRGKSQFVAAALLALSARLETDPSVRTALLDEGERAVDLVPLSFNRFWFHELAIETALDLGDTARALRSIDALVAATAEESVPWVDSVVARARTRLSET